jgi:transcriptional regulator with XRE-family HTH domain
MEVAAVALSPRRLTDARVRAGFRPVDLASRAGVSLATVVRAERGRPPTLGTVEALARALGVPVAALLSDDDAV